MDSPLCRSVSSELFPQSVSEDSGFLLSGGSSPLVPGLGLVSMEQQESDADEKSSLLDDSLAYSDVMCGDGYNTVKKGSALCNPLCEDLLSDPVSWTESPAIKPPPEFQDASPLTGTPRVSPHVTPTRVTSAARLRPARLRPGVPKWLEEMAIKMVTQVLEDALQVSSSLSWSIQCSEDCHPRRYGEECRKLLTVPDCQPLPGPRLCWTPELPYSLCRPASRSSLSSRLSSSHNSLSVPAANRVDDSSFITSAMSHEVLSTGDISDMYNVPVDCDVYAVPVDMVRPQQPLPLPPQRPKRQRHPRRKRKHASNSELEPTEGRTISSQTVCGPQVLIPGPATGKRHSRPGRSASMECTTPGEPIHMTLQEVRRYLSSLYSSSSDSSEYRKKRNPASHARHRSHKPNGGGVLVLENGEEDPTLSCNNNTVHKSNRKSTFMINMKNKKSREEQSVINIASPIESECMLIPEPKPKRGLSFSSTLKQTFCNMFRFRRLSSPEHVPVRRNTAGDVDGESPHLRPCFSTRALPPLPARADTIHGDALDSESLPSPEDPMPLTQDETVDGLEPSVDFASSIEKVKDYGWYWGPISGEAAEKILSNEPDGSFIVRDSSDDHYIFSLTFKLNSCVRHVRIEQDQGNFSFGSCTKFKSHTIVEFIENAVEHSRSGRYLFFLHRRPVLGPMRVQLLHPVSRFKQVQSLQHMCRFVILKVVRRDLISTLPLPRRVIDYLSTPHYYSEQLAEEDPTSAPPSSSPSLGDQGLFSYMPPGFSAVH